jgi:hypothetical protein
LPVHREYLCRIEYDNLRETVVTGVGVNVLTLQTAFVPYAVHHVARAHEYFGDEQCGLGSIPLAEGVILTEQRRCGEIYASSVLPAAVL